MPTWAAFENQSSQETLVPFLDMPRTRPNRLDWEMLTDWITPQDQVFNVQHYGMPEIDSDAFRLTLDGLVNKPTVLGMDQIRSMADVIDIARTGVS